jgi:hypothetical protein
MTGQHAGIALARALWVASALSLSACGDPPSDASLNGGADAGALRPRDDDQVPAIDDRAALTGWLAQRYYRAWACDARAHDGGSAVHPRMRVCRNPALLSPPPSGDYHVGAAAVAELLDDQGAALGVALAVRGLPDPGATGWYFYERWPAAPQLALTAPLEADGTLADGYGDAGGNAQAVCAACHAAATRDFVFAPGT